MNILFVANSYLTYCYVNHLDMLLGETVGSVFVLFDNSSGISDLYSQAEPYDIHVVKSFENIDAPIDLIITMQDRHFSETGIERIRQFAIKKSIKFLNVDIRTDFEVDYSYCSDSLNIETQKPVLYLLGEGGYSGLQKAEMVTCQTLQNERISCAFYFSPITERLISALNEIGYGNDIFNAQSGDNEILSVSVCNQFFIHSIRSLAINEMFIRNRPDFALLLLPNGSNPYNNEGLREAFRNKFDVKIDGVLASNFREIPPGASRADAFYVSDFGVTDGCFSDSIIRSLESFIYRKTIPDTIHIIKQVKNERKNLPKGGS